MRLGSQWGSQWGSPAELPRRARGSWAWALATLCILALGCGAELGGSTSALATVTTPAPAPIAQSASSASLATSLVLSSRPWRRTEIDGVRVELYLDRFAPATALDGPVSFEQGEAVAAVPPTDKLQVGDDVQVRFRFAFASSGEPYAGAYPAAWMATSKSTGQTSAEGCRERVELFVGGSLFSRAELDLNVYYVVTLNDDGTLSVVDPLFGFGGSKLLALVPLGGRGEDWALSAEGDRLLVSLPERDEVVLVDTHRWVVVSRLALGRRPSRVRLHPGGRIAWVMLDGEGEVAMVDLRSGQLAGRVAVGTGPHEVAFSADGETAFVTNAGSDSVSVIDAVDLRLLRHLETGDQPVSVSYSPLAGAAYVSHRGDGRIVVLRRDSTEPAATLEAEPGLGPLRFAPGGRYGFALNPKADLIHILDVASNRIVQTADLPGGPDQVTFSRELAYLRHRDHATLLMVPLAMIGREGAPVPVVDFPGGQQPFSAGSGTALADNLVRTPGETAMLVAHPADQAVYFYKEGMAAPMGSFSNYGREPRAVLVVDRSLRETRPGEYTTTVRLRQAGQYDLALFVQSPLMTHCFPIQVEARPGDRRQRSVRVRFLAPPQELIAGRGERVAFELIDEVTGQAIRDLTDVRVMVMRSPGSWHTRLAAPAIASAGGGGYAVTITPPSAGTYLVTVASASAQLALHRGGGWSFRVNAPHQEPRSESPHGATAEGGSER